MKFLFDLFPVILFVATYVLTDDLLIATAVIIPASIAQFAYVWFRYHKVDKMLLASVVLVVVMGGLTLILQDDRFIKWKPTALYWLLAAIFALAPLLVRKNLVRAIFEKSIAAPDRIWSNLNAAWVVFFVCIGAINLYVAENYPKDVWVYFKLWGLTGLTLLFVVGQLVVLHKYIKETESSQ